MPTRRVLPLVGVLVLALVPGGSTQAASGGAEASAKKPPKCKAGGSKRKCRCPKGYRVKKVTKRGKTVYRCKKKAKPPAEDGPQVPADDIEGGGDTQPTDGTTLPTEGGGEGQGAQPVRNDQALKDALASAAARKYVSSGGYSIYTYNFMPTVLTEAQGVTLYNLRYCTFSWYPGFGNSRDNYDGAWAVKEGFTRPDHPELPGLVSGTIYLYRQGMPDNEILEAGVAVYQNNATINVGSGSAYFEGGDYSFKPGQATTDCAQWEE